ncbi:MAG: DNA primase [Candidatus Omnitrophica bacterium]|nr:DNA primase [Candidatus Omnitrophota bacterium]
MGTLRIPEHILDEILSRVDIVEVISGYIPLKRTGRNFKALCPFHHEKTPSFIVSPDRQIYHCFGCGVGGNAFGFLMQYERMDFLEAVRTLAQKAGVILPKPEEEDGRTSGILTQLYRINELTTSFYQNFLNSSSGALAKNYLLKRQLKEETLKSFKLGFAPQKWDALMNYLRQKGLSISLLEKAGVILAKQDGGYYDRFRNRIIFPIFDIKSRVVGFGGRILPGQNTASEEEELPKYINSPETPIYSKGKNLYGLHLAKDAIRQMDSAVIVEGYLDFILPYQEGLKNLVASLGTALTYEQARLLKRYTHNVVMVYDADKAGEIATLRSLDIFIEEEMTVRVVSLDKDYDPDLFVRKFGIENFKKKISHAESLFDYKLKILKSRYNPEDIQGKATIVAEMLATINKFNNAILKSEYLKQLAEALELKEETLLEELKKLKRQNSYPQLSKPGSGRKLHINPTEKLLVKLMLEEAELLNHIRQRLEPKDFQDERISRIVGIMFNLLEQGKTVNAAKLMNYLEDEEILKVICESTFLPEVLREDKERVVDDCINRLKEQRLRFERQKLHDEIRSAQHSGDKERLNSLIQEFHNLIKKR